MSQTILEELKPKLKKLNTIPNLNYGGCAIVSLALFRLIKKEAPQLKPKIVFGYTSKEELDYDKNNLKTNGNTPNVTHAVVRVKGGTFIDSRGMLKELTYGNSYKMDYHFSIKTKKEVLSTINSDCWNRSFDRRNKKRISQILNINLQDVRINV